MQKQYGANSRKMDSSAQAIKHNSWCSCPAAIVRLCISDMPLCLPCAKPCIDLHHSLVRAPCGKSHELFSRPKARRQWAAHGRWRSTYVACLIICDWAVQVVPRTIAENSGLNATEAVALLHAAHANGQTGAGLDIETGQPRDLSADGIVDVYSTKW